MEDEKDRKPAIRQWALWRQDDNGNRFLVCVKETREEVHSLQEAYEKRGHKQYYFIEPFKEDTFSSQDN